VLLKIRLVQNFGLVREIFGHGGIKELLGVLLKVEIATVTNAIVEVAVAAIGIAVTACAVAFTSLPTVTFEV